MSFVKITFRESVLKPGSRDELTQTLFAGKDYDDAWTDGAFIFASKNDKIIAYHLGVLLYAEVEMD